VHTSSLASWPSSYHDDRFGENGSVVSSLGLSHPEVRAVAEARCRDVLAAFDRADRR